MKFEFDKFVEDLEKRQEVKKENQSVNEQIAEQDRLRRLRAEHYHEKWQNRIKWER